MLSMWFLQIFTLIKALPGYGSSNGLEVAGMTRMETLDGAPNASQPVLQALDLVEDDWCLGSFMNLGAGSSAQAVLFHAGVLGSPAICATYLDGLKMSDVLLVATLPSLRTHDDDDIQLQYDTKHPLSLTRYYDCRLYNQINPSFYCTGIDTVSLSDDIRKVQWLSFMKSNLE
ncbi:uncharacterized protein BX664DRAFT_353888 [Halteromyces radiatus]|uniref:uncharacterized protein n=1 Tax=Halteromyces radiatus TaxID=101107 RepID=UPI00221FC360|nr:uncharacterized protein BX664DRAFT_353888 [Halteromyces radiatus]KAI8076918.1 hypothetical protein BX664DRAFT_353888 [Halteromyces radiatus]